MIVFDKNAYQGCFVTSAQIDANLVEATEPTKRKRGRPRLTPETTVASGISGSVGEAQSVGPEALVEMALGLLAEQPPSEITRASLARHANVDPGLIRYYFKNRDSLMRTVAESLTATLQQRASAQLSQPPQSAADQITARVKALLSFKLDNPFYHRLMMEDIARSDSEESRALFDDVSQAAISRYAGFLSEGIQDGSLRDVNPSSLYMAIIGLCEFYVTASPVILKGLDKKKRQDANAQYAAFISDILLNGLRPR
jgi:TetR/AcrR family transcriptional regulator